MKSFPKSINNLIDEFSRLPGIGRKTGQRLAFHILKSDTIFSQNLSSALLDIKMSINDCSLCGAMTEEEYCSICIDPKRLDSILCVVEEASDIYTFEKTNSYNGKYHVLGGVLSPLDGVGPDELNIKSLIKRIIPGTEIIIATNPSVEGDTTTLYLAKLLEEMEVNITRLARGVPVGGSLDYVDEMTLVRAMENRTSL